MIFGTTVNNIDNRFSEILKKLPLDKQNIYIEICETIAEKLSK